MEGYIAVGAKPDMSVGDRGRDLDVIARFDGMILMVGIKEGT